MVGNGVWGGGLTIVAVPRGKGRRANGCGSS